MLKSGDNKPVSCLGFLQCVFYLDYHKPAKKDLVKLPDEFTRKKIEASMDGQYGYIVFKVN